MRSITCGWNYSLEGCKGYVGSHAVSMRFSSEIQACTEESESGTGSK